MSNEIRFGSLFSNRNNIAVKKIGIQSTNGEVIPQQLSK